jgi:two-component system C4-dicarboxylate transport sensor histidine kinase DctB
VIVVSISFKGLETAWAQQKGLTFISDPHDIVVVSGRKDWHFRTLRSLRSEEVHEIAQTRVFNSDKLKPIHFDADGDTLLVDGQLHRQKDVVLSLDGAHLKALVPIQAALQGARAQARIVVFAAFAIMAVIAAVLFRQSERLAMQRAARLDLERTVGERTSALQVANEKLVREGTERERSEERYRQSREELAQANRLATLGQVTAGVAHEINQPVAAIRTYAENSAVFLARGQQDRVRDNTDQIIALTVRIAEITKELRTFARRRPPEIGLVRLDDSIDAALLLLRYRIGRSRVTVTWDRQSAELAVRADRVRLEQVFVNLIQNALDAIAVHEGGRIDLRVSQEGGEVDIDIADNGAGMPSEIQRRLFTPFTTGRAEGLGLGLAIARDILREFGGDLMLVATSPEGTTFRVRLVHR